MEILYNKFIYIEYVYLKSSTDRVYVLLILCFCVSHLGTRRECQFSLPEAFELAPQEGATSQG